MIARKYRLSMFIGGVVIAASIGGCAVGSATTHRDSSAPAGTGAAVSDSHASAPAAAPAPDPSPDGTFSGSCDYTLGSDPVGGTARAIGEVDLDNTGNIGTHVRVTISWPQLGYASLTMHRTVRTTPGQHKAVRFHLQMSGTQVDNLQAWQEGHDFKDGCHYHASILDTIGDPQS